MIIQLLQVNINSHRSVDITECEDLISSGMIGLIRDSQNPLMAHMTIKGSSLGFDIYVPRFYPHKPPSIFIHDVRAPVLFIH